MSGYGGFAQGLFGGIGSVFQLYGMYQGIQNMSAQQDAAGAVKEASEADQGLYQEGKHPAAQDMSRYTSLTQEQADAAAPATSSKSEVDTSKIAAPAKASAIKPLTGADLPSPQAPPPVTQADFATGGANPMATPASPAALSVGMGDRERQGYTDPGPGPTRAAAALPVAPRMTAPSNMPTYDVPMSQPGALSSGQGTPQAQIAQTGPAPTPTGIGPNMSAAMTNRPIGATLTGAGALPTRYPPGTNAAQAPVQAPAQASAPLPAAPVPQGPPPGPQALNNPPPSPPGVPSASPWMDQLPRARQGATGYVVNPDSQSQDRNNVAPPPGYGAPPPPSAMSRILSAINPIGSAQAAEPTTGPNGLPMAQRDTPAPAPAPAQTPGQTGQTPAAITPATPPTPSDTKPAPTTPGPVQVAVTGKTGAVAPGQTTPSTQSETTPQMLKPAMWTRPYELLREQRPDLADLVTRIADEHGVSPYRLASHWYAESRLKTTSPVSYKGARGPMQVIDDTRKNVDPKGIYNPEKLEDSLHLGALVIYGADQKYGKDSMGSYLAYQGGEGSANAAADNFEQFKQTHPQGYAYLRDNFPGVDIAQNMFTRWGGGGDPARLVAAANGGPDAMLREIVTSSPAGMGMTDAWRHAQTALVYAAAMKGDYAGMQHAQDFVYQMSHQGALANMAAAHQALMTGDTTGAAQALAKAHAFFPDNSYGRFGTGADGKLYGERLDEASGKPVGKRFEITKEGLLYQLMSVHDPKEYVRQVQAQQKLVEDARYHDATLTKDYVVAGMQSGDKAADRGQRTTASELASETQLAVAGIRTGGRNQTPAGQTQELHTLGVDATKRYGENAQDPENSAKLAPIYTELRRQAVLKGTAMPDAQADSLARKLSQGTGASGLRMRDNNDGTTGVYEKNSDTPVGHIDTGLARSLAGSRPIVGQQGALNVSPIGSQPQAQAQPRAYV